MLARRLALGTAVLVVLAGVAALALRYTHPPYVWLAATGVLVLAILFVRSRGAGRVLAFNAAAIVLVLGLGETWCWLTTPAGRLRTVVEPAFVNSHDYLGNAPYPDMTTTVTRFDRDSLLFQVTYAIDSLGWRITPPVAGAGGESRLVAFFGCSLTFGEGVADSATLPAQIERVSQGRLRGVNFGFSGYGPHQMLAILEHRLEVAALPTPPVLGVYQAIPDHVYRALGRTSWDPGPRYVAGAAGEVRFTGRFFSPLRARLRDFAQRSYLYRRVSGAWLQPVSDRDLALFLDIVAAARREFTSRYPASEFVVLYWDTREDTPGTRSMDQRILGGLDRRGVRVLRASDLLPEYPALATRYQLSLADPHPNAHAYRTLASSLVGWWFGDSASAPGGNPPGGISNLPAR